MMEALNLRKGQLFTWGKLILKEVSPRAKGISRALAHISAGILGTALILHAIIRPPFDNMDSLSGLPAWIICTGYVIGGSVALIALLNIIPFIILRKHPKVLRLYTLALCTVLISAPSGYLMWCVYLLLSQ